MEVDLLFGQGVSKAGEIIDLGILYGIIDKTGAWYSYGENKLGQGKEAARQLLEENKALFQELKDQIMQKSGLTRETAKEPPEKPPDKDD